MTAPLSLHSMFKAQYKCQVIINIHVVVVVLQSELIRAYDTTLEKPAGL